MCQEVVERRGIEPLTLGLQNAQVASHKGAKSSGYLVLHCRNRWCVKADMVTLRDTNASRDLGRLFIHARSSHPAWLLLASRRAPLVLGCLKPLFDGAEGNVSWEDAVQFLAEVFAEYANVEEYDLPESNYLATAQRELREWIKRGLIVEREKLIFATDSLQKVFNFLANLEDDTMTSTASRLATVQREIENLEARLNPNREDRVANLKNRIAALQVELENAERGEFEVLGGTQAIEGIREIYQLATSLRMDFRRVEDSFRDADRRLRHDIIRSDQNRGSILDSMLDGHENLLATQEGRVFDTFYAQLTHAVELDQMTRQVSSILQNALAGEALTRKQTNDLRWLVPILIRESERIIQARARSERDVRSFIKAGLNNEHYRVGALLNDIMEAATEVDWSSRKVREMKSPLPPVAVSLNMLPLVQRLRFKESDAEEAGELDLSLNYANLDDFAEDFWEAFDSMDRQALFERTVELLRSSDEKFTVGRLAEALPPTHDLETLAYWLGMAREAEVPVGTEREVVDVEDNQKDTSTRFVVPLVSLDAGCVEKVRSDALG